MSNEEIIILAATLIGSIVAMYFRNPIIEFAKKFKIVFRLRKISDIFDDLADIAEESLKAIEDHEVTSDESKIVFEKVQKLIKDAKELIEI